MKYIKRGVSSDKKDVHDAIKGLDKGLYQNAFCKIMPDILVGENEYALVMHADTAGTKTSLAYMYWKETGDISVWNGIVQDAIVMNLDDMACSGITDNFILSSTIGRNRNLIDGDVIKTIIGAGQDFAGKLGQYGIRIFSAGGETADVGDIVRTIDVGYTAIARIRKSDVIVVNPLPGDVIVSFDSYGQATYEERYNSGIGSNGLTYARHETLHADYARKYPETYDPMIEKDYVYTGMMKLTDQSEVEGFNIGQLLLSPTRTYLPFLKEITGLHYKNIHGIVHCTGGGQTKLLHFINDLQAIKNNLGSIPPVFRHIKQQSNASLKEMFQVFNMGKRLEIYTDEQTAHQLMEHAGKFNIGACISGYFMPFKGKRLTIQFEGEEYIYS